MIFARGISDSLTSLVKKIDEATAKNKDKKMGSFVVFLNDDEDFGDKVKAAAEKAGVKNCIMSIDNVAGPKAYKIAKEAEVTVVFYNNRKVEVNEAFKKGELNAKAVEKLISQLPKILE